MNALQTRIPESTAAYAADGYWQSRYEANPAGRIDEWLLDWKELQPLLEELCPRGASVLDVGCGNSKLCLELAASRGAFVAACDIAPAGLMPLARLQKERQATRAHPSSKKRQRAEEDPDGASGSSGGAAFLVMDARRLGFRQSSFDVIVDKVSPENTRTRHARRAPAAAASAQQMSIYIYTCMYVYICVN